MRLCACGCGVEITGRADKIWATRYCAERFKEMRRWPACTRCGRPNKRGGKTKICAECFKRAPHESRRLPGPPDSKRCPMCREDKPAKEFYSNAGRADWLSVYCKTCWSQDAKYSYLSDKDKARDRRLRARYGITLSEYNELLVAQGNKCAICGRKASDFKIPLSVDHSHEDGTVRGLLCFICNREKLGSLTLPQVEAILAYLKNPPAVKVLSTRLVPENMVKPRRRKRRRIKGKPKNGASNGTAARRDSEGIRGDIGT
jgi:hypothetical protein